jgi:(p)ppGpp synthase/HD superfamily hydrolase
MSYSRRFDSALQLACDLHRGQTRKGTGIPYVTHLLSVASLVAENGGTEDQVIAALLHDAVEDQGGERTARRILREMGPRVHRIVMACSDSVAEDPRRKAPWRERKLAHLNHLARASAGARLIAAADKVHNARTMVADLRRVGPGVWARFASGRDGTIWYLSEAARALRRNGWDSPLVGELERLIEEIRVLSGVARRAHPKGAAPPARAVSPRRAGSRSP